MLNQQLLNLALQRCSDPRIRSILQSNQSPQQMIQQLCQQKPDVAKQIDNIIGQGQNPEQLVKQLLNLK